MTGAIKQPTLILIIGVPATGKTRLARQIATRFNIPLLVKDDIKEMIFDGLGWSNREWSIKVGRTTFTLLDYMIEQQLKAGYSIIIESPYNPKFENEKLRHWQQLYKFKAVQVLCYADGEVVLDRFIKRGNSDERHSGHLDVKHIDEFREILLKGKADILDLDGEIIEVDTTDFSQVDNESIYARIQSALNV